MPAELDLAAATDAVYAADPDDFMAVRTELVGRAKAAKDRDLAKAIGALRKPTKSAWLVNLLARGAADEVASLLDLGAALREAQSSLSGPELRRLSGERAKAVRALARRAADLAGEHDQKVTDAQLQEVSQHLQAALADPALAEEVRAGQVAQIVTFGGFGPWEAGPADAGPSSTAATGSGKAADDKPEPEPEEPAGPSPEELAAARDAWKQTRTAVGEAETALAEAEQAAESATAEAERLRDELARAEQAATEADADRAAAEERLATARADADEASRLLEELLD